MNRARPLLLLLQLVFALFCGVGLAKADASQAEPGAKVTLAAALADARRLARVPGDTVLRVEGRSMLPYFGDGSVLVVRASAVEALRPGMVVVYRNRFGETVAHRIESGSPEGWVVRGANNAVADSTLVTAENLLGTVYVTLYSDSRDRGSSLRLAGQGSPSVAVALAAPAR